MHLSNILFVNYLSKDAKETSVYYECKTFNCHCHHEVQNSTFARLFLFHYDDVIMGAMASEIISLTIVYSTVYSGADQRKHQSSASLALVRGIHRGPMNSPHKWPVTRKMFPFDDAIMRPGPCINEMSMLCLMVLNKDLSWKFLSTPSPSIVVVVQ